MTGRWSDESLRQLRVGRHVGDGAAMVALLSGQPLAEVLQLVGDAVVDAVASGVPGAAELAEQCVAALGERGWEGDEDLAEQLAAALDRGPVPLLRPGRSPVVPGAPVRRVR